MGGDQQLSVDTARAATDSDAAPHRPRDFHRRWPTLRLPLRPDATVAAAMDAVLPPADAGPTLLLGVTPELAALPRRITALDWSAAMIEMAWLGDDAMHTVVLADWKAMPLADGSMAAAMGDGALTMLHWPHDAVRVMSELARVVRPGGRVVLRCFATPLPTAPVEQLAQEVRDTVMPFHLFKLRFNMAVARENADITVASRELFERFETLFPDRAALSAATGWPIDVIAEIDAYRGSSYVHCYPARAELQALADAHWPGTQHFVATSGYPGAELCPLWVLDRA